MLPFRQIRRKQPQTFAPYDYGSEPLKRMKLAVVKRPQGVLMEALAGGTNDGGSFGATGHGNLLTPFGLFQTSSGSGFGDRCLLPAILPSTDSTGLICWGLFYKAGTASIELCFVSSPSGQTDAQITLNSGGTITFAANAAYTFTSAALADGVHSWAFSNDRAGGNQSAWIDGVVVDTSGTSTAQTGFNAQYLRCGINSTGTVGIAYSGFSAGKAADAARVAVALWQNPWCIFRERRLTWAPPPTGVVTAYFPGTDVSVAGWTPTGAASVAGSWGESVLSRAEYSESSDLTVTATCTWKDNTGAANSIPAGTWDIQVDGHYLAASGKFRLTLKDSGGTSVGASAFQAITGTDATYTVTVTTTGASDRFTLDQQA